MGKYRKKPVVIEAFQFDGSEESATDIAKWSDAVVVARNMASGKAEALYVETMEGEMRADPGDWIIRGVKGEFYPCKPDIFAATYEPA